jgi:hypothetical protein
MLCHICQKDFPEEELIDGLGVYYDGMRICEPCEEENLELLVSDPEELISVRHDCQQVIFIGHGYGVPCPEPAVDSIELPVDPETGETLPEPQRRYLCAQHFDQQTKRPR